MNWSAVADQIGVEVPPSIVLALESAPANAAARMCVPEPDESGRPSVHSALDQLRQNPDVPPFGLLPIAFVDEESYACVVCAPSNVLPARAAVGAVVRIFVTRVPRRYQLDLLDTQVESYLDALASQLTYRISGLEAIEKAASRYKAEFTDQGETPKANKNRPVRLACQNVVIGVAVFRYDRRSDALVVQQWQTTEVAHVATHEGDRAMAALMLSDAFRSGGTMEIRFDQHPERRVPGTLGSFARTRGLTLGRYDRRSIHPAEARELFLAVTTMPESMRSSLLALCTAVGLSPERICYLIASGVWLPLELDFLMSSCDTVGSIVIGGTAPFNRIDYQRQLLACRSALLLGLAYRRQQNLAKIDDDQPDTFEDSRNHVEWTVSGGLATLTTTTTTTRREPSAVRRMTYLPAPVGVLPGSSRPADPNVALLIPQDVEPIGWDGPVARMPMTVAELDVASARNLLAAQVGRR